MILSEDYSFSIDKDWYVEKPNSYGLYIKRSDGQILPNPEYFPKSVINPRVQFNTLKVTIPNWLWNKKVALGNTIVER